MSLSIEPQVHPEPPANAATSVAFFHPRGCESADKCDKERIKALCLNNAKGETGLPIDPLTDKEIESGPLLKALHSEEERTTEDGGSGTQNIRVAVPGKGLCFSDNHEGPSIGLRDHFEKNYNIWTRERTDPISKLKALPLPPRPPDPRKEREEQTAKKIQGLSVREVEDVIGELRNHVEGQFHGRLVFELVKRFVDSFEHPQTFERHDLQMIAVLEFLNLRIQRDEEGTAAESGVSGGGTGHVYVLTETEANTKYPSLIIKLLLRSIGCLDNEIEQRKKSPDVMYVLPGEKTKALERQRLAILKKISTFFYQTYELTRTLSEVGESARPFDVEYELTRTLFEVGESARPFDVECVIELYKHEMFEEANLLLAKTIENDYGVPENGYEGYTELPLKKKPSIPSFKTFQSLNILPFQTRTFRATFSHTVRKRDDVFKLLLYLAKLEVPGDISSMVGYCKTALNYYKLRRPMAMPETGELSRLERVWGGFGAGDGKPNRAAIHEFFDVIRFSEIPQLKAESQTLFTEWHEKVLNEQHAFKIKYFPLAEIVLLGVNGLEHEARQLYGSTYDAYGPIFYWTSIYTTLRKAGLQDLAEMFKKRRPTIPFRKREWLRVDYDSDEECITGVHC